MNWQLFFYYVAIGALAKLLTIKNPTPGSQWAAGIEVVAGGLFLGALVPIELTAGAAIVAAVPFVFSIVGSLAGRLVDWMRIQLEMTRGADGYKSKGQWSERPTIGRASRFGAGPGKEDTI